MTHKNKITPATSPLFYGRYRKIKTGVSMFLDHSAKCLVQMAISQQGVIRSKMEAVAISNKKALLSQR